MADFADRVINLVAPVPVFGGPLHPSLGVGSTHAIELSGEGITRRTEAHWRAADGTVRSTPILDGTYSDGTRAHAYVPREFVATPQTLEVRLFNPGPGGGWSAARPLFIVADGAASVGHLLIGTSDSPTGTVAVTTYDGTLGGEARGVGTLVLAQYYANPVPLAPPQPTGVYFDVYTMSGSDFGAVTVRRCGLAGESAVYWYDPLRGAWAPVVGQAYDGAGCVTLQLTGLSSPGVVQLTGTVFAVATAPATMAGFYQPVDMAPPGGELLYNTVRGGATVPLKFAVRRGATPVTDPAAIRQPLTATRVDCLGGATLDEVEQTAIGGTALRYDAAAGHFVYNWQTPAGPRGSCWRVTVATADGTAALTAHFKLR